MPLLGPVLAGFSDGYAPGSAGVLENRSKRLDGRSFGLSRVLSRLAAPRVWSCATEACHFYRVDPRSAGETCFSRARQDTLGEAAGSKNDFLGVGVPSFGATRGSHLAFLDLATGRFEQILGQHMPAQARMVAKIETHDHPKPERPSEETLARMASAMPLAARRGGGAAAPPLRGITRTARYREAAERVAGMMHAPQG